MATLPHTHTQSSWQCHEKVAVFGLLSNQTGNPLPPSSLSPECLFWDCWIQYNLNVTWLQLKRTPPPWGGQDRDAQGCKVARDNWSFLECLGKMESPSSSSSPEQCWSVVDPGTEPNPRLCSCVSVHSRKVSTFPPLQLPLCPWLLPHHGTADGI